jgi:hypothetical protein
LTVDRSRNANTSFTREWADDVLIAPFRKRTYADRGRIGTGQELPKLLHLFTTVLEGSAGDLKLRRDLPGDRVVDTDCPIERPFEDGLRGFDATSPISTAPSAETITSGDCVARSRRMRKWSSDVILTGSEIKTALQRTSPSPGGLSIRHDVRPDLKPLSTHAPLRRPPGYTWPLISALDRHGRPAWSNVELGADRLGLVFEDVESRDKNGGEHRVKWSILFPSPGNTRSGNGRSSSGIHAHRHDE